MPSSTNAFVKGFEVMFGAGAYFVGSTPKPDDFGFFLVIKIL